jgi:hypothetical protein
MFTNHALDVLKAVKRSFEEILETRSIETDFTCVFVLPDCQQQGCAAGCSASWPAAPLRVGRSSSWSVA